MTIAMIGCPFLTSYGAYIQSLANAIKRKTGSDVQWIASNCGCDDPVERSRTFQTTGIDYFEVPIVGESGSPQPLKRWLRDGANNLGCAISARRFARRQQAAQVVHFQQVLNGYGSNVAFRWVGRPGTAARFITVHELDAFQTRNPAANRAYNKADGVFVHSQELKERLVELQVRADLIHVVPHGTEIPAAQAELPRSDLIFYGGHKLMTGKGIETLFAAMALVVRKLGSAAPRLKIHGHYGTATPPDGVKLARTYGLEDRIDWLNQISMEDTVKQYQRALICVLPFVGSFAGLPAGIAAANGLPVIATRKAGIPEHLGDNAFWVDEHDPAQLADRIEQLLSNEDLRREQAEGLRLRARTFLSWDVIAQRTLDIYEQALASRLPDAHPDRIAPGGARQSVNDDLRATS